MDREAGAVFVVSPTLTDAVARIATAAGWNVIADDGADGVADRFRAADAAIAVVDARTDAGAGLAATGALGSVVEETGGALFVIAPGDEMARVHDAGATGFLATPASDAAIVQAIRFAARQADRSRAGVIGNRRIAGAMPSTDDAAAAIRQWIADRIARGAPVAVVVVALSRLDILNAAHGRTIGDALILAAADRIVAIATARFGAAALMARIGGSEFVLALGAQGHSVATATGELGEALARPFTIGTTSAVLGNRFGVAEHQPGDDAVALLRRAGEALAGAKASDGAVLRIADPDGVAPIDSLAADLHHAIERGEIDVLFQPQVEIASGRIVGVEALARWNHARLGPLGADALFAAADRADLGIALSDHIQQLTLGRAAKWPRSLDGVRLSLNLTAADITRTGFAALFLARVDASGFPRGRLTVEITETGLIRDLDTAAALLASLRGAGCRVAMDDFGTGYSSLAYLKALPLDYLKIDRALARDIDGSPRDRVVVRGVIDMARALGLAVIAEGVETPTQLALLAADGCGYYQGFLRARPLDEAGLIAMIEEE